MSALARRAAPSTRLARASCARSTLATPAPSGARAARRVGGRRAGAARARRATATRSAALRIPRIGLRRRRRPRHRRPPTCARARACSTRHAAARASAGRRRSPGTARPTSRRSATSTALRRGDAITVAMPYGTLPLRGRGHADRRSRATCGRCAASATTGSCCPPVIRSIPPLVASSSSRGWSGVGQPARALKRGVVSPIDVTETGAAGARAHTDARPVHESACSCNCPQGAHRALATSTPSTPTSVAEAPSAAVRAARRHDPAGRQPTAVLVAPRANALRAARAERDPAARRRRPARPTVTPGLRARIAAGHARAQLEVLAAGRRQLARRRRRAAPRRRRRPAASGSASRSISIRHAAAPRRGGAASVARPSERSIIARAPARGQRAPLGEPRLGRR